MNDIKPQQLIDALTANGWTLLGEQNSAYARLCWPRQPGEDFRTMAIPAADDASGIGRVLAELARAADTGRRAAAVLASLGGQPAQRYATPDVIGQVAWLYRNNSRNNRMRFDAMAAANYDFAKYTAVMNEPVDKNELIAHLRREITDLEGELTQLEGPASDSGPTPRAQSDLDGLYELGQAAFGDYWGEASWTWTDFADTRCSEATSRFLEAVCNRLPGLLAKPAPAGLDLSPAVERITAIEDVPRV